MRALLPSDPARVGRYRMLARLGVGGMGKVYLGSGPDGRLVALKLVSEDWLEDSGFRDRFRGEVAASRKVSGGYTAAVIDADPEAEMPWLASEFVLGVTLADAVEHAGRLPVDAVRRLAAGLASALDVIHRADLVHRDLKPTNILLTDSGLRVIDFGIARATDNTGGGHTRTGRIVGTAGYMSPEQAEGGTVTGAGDVFCLGAVLAMAATGSGPFDGSSDPTTMYNIVHKDPDLAAVPADLKPLIAHCLRKEPGQRPSPARVGETIGELAPAARPWPQAVHDLIARQQAAVDAAIAAPGATANPDGGVDATRLLTRLAEKPRRSAAAVVNGWYTAADRRVRALLADRRPPPDKARDRGRERAQRQARDKCRGRLTLARDIALIVAGALLGMFIAADLNIGSTIDSDRGSLGIGGGELERALTHAGYFGAVAGFLIGGVAAALLRMIVGKRAQRFSRIALAAAAGAGFALGWLAEHEYLTIELLSLGVMDDVSRNEDEAGLVVLGVIIGFFALGCGLWVIGRAIPVLALVGFIPAAAVGAAWAYLGATGFVVDGGMSIGVATVIGATVGGGLAARLVNSIRDRRPAPPKARAW